MPSTSTATGCDGEGSSTAKKLGNSSFLSQTKALLIKNLRVKRRMKQQFIFELFFPIYMTVIVTLINLAASETKYAAMPFHKPQSLIPENPALVLAVVTNDISSYKEFVSSINKTVATEWTSPKNLSVFSSEDDFMEFYLHNLDNFWAALFLPHSYPDDKFLNYTIRIQHDSSSSTSDFLVPTATREKMATGTQCRNHTTCDAEDYVSSGFLELQRAVDMAWFTANGGNDSSFPKAFATVMPQREMETSSNNGIATAAVILLIMAFSSTVQYLMTNVVAEKQHGIKEAMYLMGMKQSAYWVSWLLTYAITLIFPALIMTIISCTIGVYSHSNFFAVLIVFYVFSLSLVPLGFMMTPFFSDSKVAGIAGSLTNTILSLLTFAMNNGNISTAAKFGSSLVSPCAVSLALNAIVEGNENGFSFTDLNSSSDGSSYTVAISIAMMLGDSLLYLVIAWYLDAVVPGNGVTRPALFPLYSLLSFLGLRQESALAHHTSQLIEEGERENETELMRQQIPVISIENVGMEYNKKDGPALSSVSLKLFDGQIFGLLGHNGAGKTTLHSIITGMHRPTAGKVFVNGMDLALDSTHVKMRSSMGVCPQQDILYDVLTVQEHVELYASIKGIHDTAKINSLLDEIDLMDKKNEFAAGLSGGQKRKLSVGIALIGDPKILCLDEPSSGMDPYSRRKLWELLQSKRQGRVTLLTTHYMQEADILADRKAILSRGRIQCVGSSLFLKSTFGVGYHLNIAKEDNTSKFDRDGVTSIITKHLPNATVEHGESRSEISYSLPSNKLGQYADLLDDLNNTKKSFGVKAFGVSMTTLEEVFIRLQEKEENQILADQDKEIEKNQNHSNNGMFRNEAEGVEEVEEEDADVDSVSEKTSLLPLVSVNSRNGAEAYHTNSALASVKPPTHPSLWLRMRALMLIRLKQNMRTIPALIFQIVLPGVLMTISMTVVAKPKAPSSALNFGTLPFTTDVYDEGFSIVPVLDHSAANIFTSLLNATLPTNSSSFSVNKTTAMQGNGGFLTNSVGNETFATAFEYSDTSNMLNMFVNGTFIHTLPIAMSLVNNAFMSVQNVSTLITSHPLKGSEEVKYDATLFYTVLLIGIGLSAIPGGFAVDIVRDRASKMKHQLKVSGVSRTIYWTSYLIMNSLIFSWAGLFAVVLSQAVKIQPLMGPALPMFIILCIVYIPLCTLFSFNCSFFFTVPETAVSVFPPLANFLGFIPYIVVATIDGLGRSVAAKALHFAFAALIPNYSLLGAMYYMFRISLSVEYDPFQDSVTTEDIWAPKNNVSTTLFVMVGSLLAQIAILSLIENWSQLKRRYFGKSSNKDSDYEDEDSLSLDSVGLVEDEDVKNEREEVAQHQGDTRSALRVVRLRKVFPSHGRKSKKFTAVRDSSFCVNEGDLLGLLGPNGAGKTTSISVITSEEPPTCGEVYVAGNSLFTQTNKAMSMMGYCPQASALWERITTEEHLQFFASIKGHASDTSTLLARQQMKLFGITEHSQKWSKNLSGGTKRKLNVAISLINHPSVCLLDEPSTGMDPNSKRTLWNVIKTNTNSMAAILTTHSMEEAEALCNKIAIMVKGRIVCIGSPTHLKNKYGTGYSLEVKTLNSRVGDIEEILKEKFDGVELEENFDGHATYRLDIQDNNLATVFRLMEAKKSDMDITEYALSQSTLEQVFLRFAKLQDVDIENVEGNLSSISTSSE
eukprot:m.21271 g.21271  ORF g.21271 m.21271 type:complete len:1697 (+) comp5336_c0_seq2:82-5172(+)